MGKIITFSGPRGVGKTSVMDNLRDDYGISPIVPYTTRDPRAGEVDGVDYNFVTGREFDAIRRREGMFDVLALKDKKYGTPLEDLYEVIEGPDGDVEHTRTINLAAHSALQLREQMGREVVGSLVLLPERWSDIEEQMRANGIPEEQILARRATEPTDLTLLPNFDQIIVNPYGKPGEAVRKAADFISQVVGVELLAS